MAHKVHSSPASDTRGLSRRSLRLAARWFAWLGERHESVHLEPAHRDAVAAEVALAVVRGWAVRAWRPLRIASWLLLLVVLLGGRGLGVWLWASLLLLTTFGLELALWPLHVMSRRQALRRLQQVLEREASAPAISARLLWAPAAAQLRLELERARADLWARSRAVSWREVIVAAAEGASVQAIVRYDLATEAADKAVRDPLVRTFWRLGFLCVALSPLLLLLATAGLITTWSWLRSLGFAACFVLVVLPCLFLAAELRGRRLARRRFREILLAAGQRPARCFVCRCDLAGVTASRCPQCGVAIGRDD